MLMVPDTSNDDVHLTMLSQEVLIAQFFGGNVPHSYHCALTQTLIEGSENGIISIRRVIPGNSLLRLDTQSISYP